MLINITHILSTEKKTRVMTRIQLKIEPNSENYCNKTELITVSTM